MAFKLHYSSTRLQSFDLLLGLLTAGHNGAIGADVHAAVMVDYNIEFDAARTGMAHVTVTALTYDSVAFRLAHRVIMLSSFVDLLC